MIRMGSTDVVFILPMGKQSPEEGKKLHTPAHPFIHWNSMVYLLGISPGGEPLTAMCVQCRQQRR